MIQVPLWVQWLMGFLLILSSFGVIVARKPIYASLSFLLSLMVLATFYLLLSAQFIAVMQILIYAGAILVIFVFVIVLFQDAHQQISRFEPKSNLILLSFAGSAFLALLIFLGIKLTGISKKMAPISDDFGTVQALGKALYLDFFFPFEAIILLFLIAVVGALYIAKRER